MKAHSLLLRAMYHKYDIYSIKKKYKKKRENKKEEIILKNLHSSITIFIYNGSNFILILLNQIRIYKELSRKNYKEFSLSL